MKNTEWFIAKRLSFDKNESRLTRLMSRISMISVALSMTVMIVAVAMLTGFKSKLQEKISGFNAHLRISNYDANQSFEGTPIRNDYPFIDTLRKLPHVKHIQQYALKGGIIRTDDEIQGVILKGIGTDFDWSFFKQYMIEGDSFQLSDTANSNQSLISRSISKLLKLNTGDSFEVYFAENPVRVRKFTVSGIYDTYFEDMDKVFVLCDIRHIRRLNRWENNQITGIEIMADRLNRMDEVYSEIENLVAYRTFADGSRLDITSIRDAFPQLFNWLAIQDINVLIILIIMLVVAGFNMISGLLIMLLEKISMIGTLKALGMRSSAIMKIFVYRSSLIVLRGLLAGILVGVSLCLLQQKFSLIQLDQSIYYFAAAPVELNFWRLALLALCSFVLISALQIIPSMIITRISPDKSMKME
ncbi:MAG: ABC transporter permease [Prevotellaceae bacterium]|jgi:lipoprotein-releasing system permease protein|nr:ABC transporter permease [Prevotellaceae bacterium]